ncbi:MAG: ABC transporter [Clostridia bacterium]|nr:ABC transporter [Clostridia bacterium]
MKAIYRRELHAYFSSPVGYVFAAVWFLLSGAVFSLTTLFAMTSSVTSYFTYMLLAMTVLLPLLTMKTFSEERRQKTEQIWQSAPVSLWGVVTGKFLAAMTLFAGCVCVSSLAFLILPLYGKVKAGILFGNLLALLLAGATFLAVGTFVSSLCVNQLASAVVTVAVLLAFLGVGLLSSFVSFYPLRFVLNALSVFSRFSGFSQGVFDPAALVYDLSLTAIFLFLTVRVYDRRRLR